MDGGSRLDDMACRHYSTAECSLIKQTSQEASTARNSHTVHRAATVAGLRCIDISTHLLREGHHHSCMSECRVVSRPKECQRTKAPALCTRPRGYLGWLSKSATLESSVSLVCRSRQCRDCGRHSCPSSLAAPGYWSLACATCARCCSCRCRCCLQRCSGQTACPRKHCLTCRFSLRPQ
jgi:hypothetical protein